MATEAFPPIMMAAHPVSQDRREEIVTSGLVDKSLEAVWDALAEPSRVGSWLGVAGAGWAVPGATTTLDFEDGEFFWCKFDIVVPPDEGGQARLGYRWRWNGVGPAAEVEWCLVAADDATLVTVTESLVNGPNDWRSWNGMGWPGIIDQLAQHLVTQRNTRWTWRRMGPYVQYVVPCPTFVLWQLLTSSDSLAYWMGRTHGSFTTGDPMTFMLGDASGTAQLTVTQRRDPNQEFPSYQPSFTFEIIRDGSPGPLSGYLWLEPAGLGESILQVFMSGWEKYGALEHAPIDRKLFTEFWVGAFGRLASLAAPPGGMAAREPGGAGPHGWST